MRGCFFFLFPCIRMRGATFARSGKRAGKKHLDWSSSRKMPLFPKKGCCAACITSGPTPKPSWWYPFAVKFSMWLRMCAEVPLPLASGWGCVFRLKRAKPFLFPKVLPMGSWLSKTALWFISARAPTTPSLRGPLPFLTQTSASPGLFLPPASPKKMPAPKPFFKPHKANFPFFLQNVKVASS